MDKFNMIKRIKLELSGVKPAKMEEGGLENACWEGYEPIGLKDDGSPNCVPIKEEQSKVKEGFPIPSPSGDEDEQAYISRCISNIIDEYGQEQAAAMCYNRWENK
jgi:hypothetical protein